MWRPERVMQAPVSFEETGPEFSKNSGRATEGAA